ncbi:MAG: glycosyltransferase, partial [Bacteroidia bacterium]|nr:glycosyltransferase [Bacteroidia bacterium]
NRKRNYTFLFAGRYAPEKNVQTLWNVFIELCEEYPNNWILLCAGKGNVPAIQHPQIKHLGFLQPNELADVLLNTDVFILPSKFEPWGVIIHEVTTAGLPVITSNTVGANDFFVRHQENGFIFDINCKKELKQYLIYMMKVSDEEYFRMSDKSYELSTQVTTQNWIKKIYHLCKI